MFHQVFNPPLSEDQIISESRSSLVPRRLGRGGSVDESRESSGFAGSRNIPMIEKRGWPLFDRVTGRNFGICPVSSKRKTNGAGDVRNTSSNGIPPDMELKPEEKQTRLMPRKPSHSKAYVLITRMELGGRLWS